MVVISLSFIYEYRAYASKNTTPEIPVSRYLAEVYLSSNPRDAVQRVNTLCREIPVTRFRFQEERC